MPNWCSCNLYIFTDRKNEKILDEICSFLYGDDSNPIFLEKIIPTPEELLKERLTDDEVKENKKTFGFPSWYEWRVTNWGTKWDIDNALFESFDTDELSCMVYKFETAWSPPDIAISKLSYLYPDPFMLLTYDEPGMDFSGHILYKSGGILEREHKEISAINIYNTIYDPDINYIYLENVKNNNEE